MMESNTMKDLFSAFTDSINKSDVYALTAMANMSAAIIKKRISLGMTQKEFANYLGVTQGMLSRWENTEYNFTIKTMSELCEKIGCSFAVNIEKEKSVTAQAENNQSPYMMLFYPPKLAYTGTANQISPEVA